jgi:hypothetical protein
LISVVSEKIIALGSAYGRKAGQFLLTFKTSTGVHAQLTDKLPFGVIEHAFGIVVLMLPLRRRSGRGF